LGISLSTIELLIQLRRAGHLAPGGAVVEIGAQQLGSTFFGDPERLAELGRLFGVDRPFSVPTAPLAQQTTQIIDFSAPFARDFWHWLRLQYAAIDIDGSPESIPLDLNYDSVPPAAKGKYQLVTNFGTTEHVANQLNAFNIIHDLTAPNGIMVHEVPTQGMLNHGLVNYNFKFFWLLSRSNGYKVIHSDFMPGHDYEKLPKNVLEFLTEANLTGARRTYEYKSADAGMLMVVQKSYDIPFVPPLDVDTGASTEIDAIKKRYWTVFEQNPFDRLHSNGAVESDTASGAVKSSAVITSMSPPHDQTNLRSVPFHAIGQSANLGGTYTADPMPVQPGKLGALMRPLRTLRQVIRASLAHLAGTDQKAEQIRVGLANHTDLMRRNLEALLRVMTELRDIQKAQLFMQRTAAEALKQSAMATTDSSPAKRPEAN